MKFISRHGLPVENDITKSEGEQSCRRGFFVPPACARRLGGNVLEATAQDGSVS